MNAVSENAAGAARNLHPKTATLYSAALEDGDYHTVGDRLTSAILSLVTPFNEKMQVNRTFGQKMYQEFARQKFTSVFDIGAGPMPKGHEWAPGGKYLYVDHNPGIVEHARKKLKAADQAIYEVGAVGDIPRLFEAGLGQRAFGGERRIAVGSNAVLMFVPDEDIRSAFKYLYDWAERGSVITISMIGVTKPENHFRVKMIRRATKWIGAPMFLRNTQSFAALFAPWTLAREPIPAWKWLNLPPSTKTAGIGFDMYAFQLVK